MFAKDLISLLSINIKSRTDNYSDQYNRILVVKILMVCSVIMSVNWFKVSLIDFSLFQCTLMQWDW